jgi:hypothetical protein
MEEEREKGKEVPPRAGGEGESESEEEDAPSMVREGEDEEEEEERDIGRQRATKGKDSEKEEQPSHASKWQACKSFVRSLKDPKKLLRRKPRPVTYFI